MVTARIAVWPSLVGFVSDYFCQFWHGVLQGSLQRPALAGSFAVCPKPAVQLCLHAPAIWPQEQPACLNRHSFSGRHANLGTDCNLATHALGSPS